MKSLVKVWPLRPGIPGCDALGNPVILSPGLAGWMGAEEAQKAQDSKEVQIMAGLRPKDLKCPEMSAAANGSPERKKRVYRRRDMQAE